MVDVGTEKDGPTGTGSEAVKRVFVFHSKGFHQYCGKGEARE